MSLSSRSMPSGPICALVFRMFSQPFVGHFGNDGLNSGSSDRPGHISGVGVPSFWKTLKIVSISESPANNGAPVAISPRTQPTLQRSTGTLYKAEPSRISGARYQTVTTSCVYFGTGTVYARARPKSAIFRRRRWSISRFCGFRSLCKIRFAWQNSMPRQSWNARDLIVDEGSCRPMDFMYFLRSFSTNSKTSVSLFVEQKTSRSLTTFSCGSSLSRAISRIAVLGTPSSSESSFIFFMATTFPVLFCLAL
mmetsp:Transcript_78520/g.234011  ORF Transcript_78520/g.234011 Transcript_78520/m.234011 type:complete len:251 (-) Transcript_78520:208-960(-)